MNHIDAIVNQNTFGIIQSLCRIGLGTNNPAFRKQVERLKKQLDKDQMQNEALALGSILESSGTASNFQPSKMTISSSFVGTELLAPKTPPPSDRETGAALAEIIFPKQENIRFPLLDDDLEAATQSIVQEWANHEKLSAAGILPPSTVLIYGLPGTGKTCLALSVAAMLGLPVVLARLDGLISSFLGTTGRNIGNLFAFANRYRCVLLLDEFDAIAKVRDDPHEVGEIKRVVNAILQNIDQRKSCGLTIAITNHEQLLDSAVWRRFDLRMTVPLPSFKVRKSIVRRYFAPEVNDEDTHEFIAWLARGMTGADIEVMAKNVKRYQVLNPGSALLTALKHYSLTQASRDESNHRKMLSLEPKHMVKQMMMDPELKFSQRKTSKVLGISQSKISRVME